MSLKRPPRPAAMTLNLAPMVDVMMCLIIFFLLASKMVAKEHYKVELPWAVAAKEVESSALGARVTISVRQAGESGADAEYIVVDWDGQQIVERVLQPADVQAMLQARAARAQSDGQALRCVINADRAVKYQHVEAVLRACGFAKIKDIVFIARQGSDPEAPA